MNTDNKTLELVADKSLKEFGNHAFVSPNHKIGVAAAIDGYMDCRKTLCHELTKVNFASTYTPKKRELIENEIARIDSRVKELLGHNNTPSAGFR
jgi:hypothetical protein